MFLFPHNKDNEVRNIPWVTFGLIAVSFLVFAASVALFPEDELFREFGFIPAQPRVLTLFTSLFLHAGFFHLFGNMYFLWMFGNCVENMFGPWLFSLVYLASGVGGVAFHYAFHQQSVIPYVGASGAISGMAGAYVVLFPYSKFDLHVIVRWRTLKTIPTIAAVAVGAWIVEQTLLGFLARSTGVSPVAFWAHVGGFGVGVLAALTFTFFVSPKQRKRLDRGKPWFYHDRLNQQDDDITQLKL